MNSCVLMAKIISQPELRYLPDSETPIAQMLVEFETLQSNDNSMSTLKVVGWGQLGQNISENFNEGDQVLIEGRLSMNVFERKEGFKEKRAELVASRIHRVSVTSESETKVSTSNQVVNTPERPVVAVPTATATAPAPAPSEEQIDEIPF